jgi:hypothetical protein
MRRPTLVGAVASLTLFIVLVTACDGTASNEPFSLSVSPEFVQGVIPGALTGVLAKITNEEPTDAPVTITASADRATVTVSPPEIRAGEIAEISIVADPATSERPLILTVTARRGDNEETVTRATTVFTWKDDRGAYAGRLLDVFIAWLAENRPELGIGPDSEFAGSMVAPGLLIVSHYCFMSDEWELGLSWHVMVPPDDWSDLYLRPRDEAAPTLAFRLASQAGALEADVIDIAPIQAPIEVMR